MNRRHEMQPKRWWLNYFPDDDVRFDLLEPSERRTHCPHKGEASYRTDVRIDNTSGSALDGVLYRLGDCYLQGSDSGFGIHDPVSGAVGCRKSQDADARVEEWVPITSGSHYYESEYYNVVSWPTGDTTASTRGTNFPNSSDDNTSQDNGTGISWSVQIPDGGHSTFSELSAFSPTGNVPLSTSKTADSDTAAPGAQDGYTITVHNPNTSAVTLNDVTDNLPNGFSYVAGSTTDGDNNAVDDPSNDGNDNLTWTQDGGFTVPAGGDFSLHFNVDVSNTTGTYNNNADADAAGGYSVAPTGPTAQVQVAESGGSIDADLGITKSDAASPVLISFFLFAS